MRFAVVKSGFQVAFMASTEVLAEQHLKSISEFLKYSKIDIFFLSSSVKDRETVMESISTGKPGLYIGTHALIQEKVLFSNLGLVIIDEQQRFGVDQRKKLITDSDIVPDQLVMTATPIPRTTALSIYGDLDISSIKQVPSIRKPIDTMWCRNEDDKLDAYKKVLDEIRKGNQAFISKKIVEIKGILRVFF